MLNAFRFCVKGKIRMPSGKWRVWRIDSVRKTMSTRLFFVLLGHVEARIRISYFNGYGQGPVWVRHVGG